MSAAFINRHTFRRPRHRDGFFRSIATSAAVWPKSDIVAPLSATDNTSVEGAAVKVLMVNAHPDDESESAVLVYRLTHELGAAVDHVVVTNGEGGDQYTALAEAYYRLPLTPAALAQIRREELMRSSRILGIRHIYFLDQKDTGVTLDVADAFEAWDIERIRQELHILLQFESYDLVSLLLPSADSHGHHQTTAALTLETVAKLEAEDRPAVLGVRTSASADELLRRSRGSPIIRRHKPLTQYRFGVSTGEPRLIAIVAGSPHRRQLGYQRTQITGFFPDGTRRRTHEHFWLFEVSGEAGGHMLERHR